jgi:hypothetical protein
VSSGERASAEGFGYSAPMWPVATLLVALVASTTACGGGEPILECNTTVTPACAPLYPPTFENVYTMTLRSDCGSGANSCHSDRGEAGGMSFATIDGAYAALLAPGEDRVIPGDPSCSIMIIRTHTSQSDIKMPPVSGLSEAERCALVQWVAEGALRTPVPPPDAALPDAALPDAALADAMVDAP